MVKDAEMNNEKRKEAEREEGNLLYFPSRGCAGHYVCPPQSHLVHRVRITCESWRQSVTIKGKTKQTIWDDSVLISRPLCMNGWTQ